MSELGHGKNDVYKRPSTELLDLKASFAQSFAGDEQASSSAGVQSRADDYQQAGAASQSDNITRDFATEANSNKLSSLFAHGELESGSGH